MDATIGNRRLMHEMNKSLILRAIRDKGPVSRTALTEIVSLSSATVTNIVDDLLQRGFVHEAGHEESAGGRRPVLLKFAPGAGYVIGVELVSGRIRAGLVDLGAGIDRVYEEDITELSPMSAIAKIAEMIETIRHGVAGRIRIFGIGIGITGLVEPETGVVSEASNLGWRGIPLKSLIEERTGLRTTVENDCNANALAEMYDGAGQGAADLFCVTIGAGIGAGLILNGELHRGRDGSTGELGHMVVDIDGPPCKCGAWGCLETLAAGPAIVRWAGDMLKQGRVSILSQMCEGQADKLTLEMIIAALEQEDELAAQAARRAGEYIGAGIASVINLINLERVIIAGPAADLGEPFLSSIRQTIGCRALSVPASRVIVVPACLGREAGIIGPATVQIREIMNSPGLCWV